MFSLSRKPTSLREILSRYCAPYEELIKDFENSACLEHVEKGETVVRQGELCTDFIINRCGLFRVCHNTGKPTEDTILFGTSGDIFTSLHSYFAGEPSIFSLVALEDGEVWKISYDRMRGLESRHPVMVSWMRGMLIEQMYGFEKRYLFFSNKSAENRFHNFLRLNFGSLNRTSVRHISNVVPLKYIAQYLGIAQETLSRPRKKLVTGG